MLFALELLLGASLFTVFPAIQCLGKDGQEFAIQVGAEAQQEMDKLLSEPNKMSFLDQQKQTLSKGTSQLPVGMKEQLATIQAEASKVIDKGNVLGGKSCAGQLLSKGGKCTSQLNLTPKNTQDTQGRVDTKNKQILVFVSFSMPEASLQSLSQDAERHNAVLVMRGLHEDSFSKTAVKIKEMGIKVDVNPTLFESYQVTTVPTFISVQGEKPLVRLQGNVTLGFVAGKFKEQETKHGGGKGEGGRP